jgi:hypothetical protein
LVGFLLLLAATAESLTGTEGSGPRDERQRARGRGEA